MKYTYDEILHMMKWLKKFNTADAIDPSNLVKIQTATRKLKKLRKKFLIIVNITINPRNTFSSTVFDERLKQEELATKTDIADAIAKTYFNDKLKSINQKVTWNKTEN